MARTSCTRGSTRIISKAASRVRINWGSNLAGANLVECHKDEGLHKHGRSKILASKEDGGSDEREQELRHESKLLWTELGAVEVRVQIK